MNEEQIRARFEDLLLPLMDDAYNLARWLLKNQEDAEDVVQESLDFINGREVAAVVYQRNKHVINLFIWPSESSRTTATQGFARDGYNVLDWARGGFEFWLVSDVNAKDLRDLADLEMQQS